MYLVKSVHVNLSLKLQYGGVTLALGTSVDLEQFCTYAWLTADTDLQRLITAGYLTLVTDDRSTVYYTGPNATVPSIIASFYPRDMNLWSVRKSQSKTRVLTTGRSSYRGGLGHASWTAELVGINGQA